MEHDIEARNGLTKPFSMRSLDSNFLGQGCGRATSDLHQRTSAPSVLEATAQSFRLSENARLIRSLLKIEHLFAQRGTTGHFLVLPFKRAYSVS